MRLLVTGGYGLIGSALIARLHAADHDITAPFILAMLDAR
jgi:uncharacterized protein YbjT (DUF2867 family)